MPPPPPPPPQYRNAVYNSSWFDVRKLGRLGQKSPWSRLFVQLESVNEISFTGGGGGGGGRPVSSGERVVRIELRFYIKSPPAPLVWAIMLTGDTSFLQHSGLLEIQLPAETLQIKSDTQGNLQDWNDQLGHYVKVAAQVNAEEAERQRRLRAAREARAAQQRAEEARLAAQQERKSQLDSALRYAGEARRGYLDGDFKAAYANYMAGIAQFMKVLPWYKESPDRAADYAKLSSMLQKIMDSAEDAKQRAAGTYDLTVADTAVGGQARTDYLLRGVNAVTDIVRESHHVPNALKIKGRDEFSRAEGGLKTRDRVCLEIFETEKSYLEALRTLERVYLDPLRQSDAVTEEQATFINSMGVAAMVALNGKLLTDLAIRVRNWTKHQTVGDVFCRYAPFFKLYISYANSFDKLTNLLRMLTDDDATDPASARAARKILHPTKGTASVDNLLIQPIQRIPRYVLLLKELLKCTQGPPGSLTAIDGEPPHPDYALCLDALEKIENVARAVDSGMQDYKNQQKIIEEKIQESMLPPLILLDRTRTFVAEADFPYYVCHTASNAELSRARSGAGGGGGSELTYRNHSSHLAHFVLFSDSTLAVAFPVPSDRYEAALASSEAAAAVDHGRHLSWAASAVMGMDKDGPAPLHKPAKFENASKVSVKQAGPLNRAEFLAITAQFCTVERLKKIIAHVHPDLSHQVVENCATHIVVSGCTELAQQYDANGNVKVDVAPPRNALPRVDRQEPLTTVAEHSTNRKVGDDSGDDDDEGDDDDDAPPAPPPRVRRAKPLRVDHFDDAGDVTPQGALDESEHEEGDPSSDEGAALPSYRGVANSQRTSGPRGSQRKRVALRCVADFAASEVGHISCKVGEGLWGFMRSADSWAEAPPSSSSDEEETTASPKSEDRHDGGSHHVRQIVTNTDLKRVTEGATRAGGWWHGQNAAGLVGKFPAACVEPVASAYKNPAFAVELPECGPARAVFPLTISFYEAPHPIVCVAASEDEREKWLRAIEKCQDGRRRSLAGLFHRGARLDSSELDAIGMGGGGGGAQ